MRCNAAICDAMQCSDMRHNTAICDAMQQYATQCSDMRHNAAICDTLQRYATQCSDMRHNAVAIRCDFHKCPPYLNISSALLKWKPRKPWLNPNSLKFACGKEPRTSIEKVKIEELKSLLIATYWYNKNLCTVYTVYNNRSF